MYAVGRRKSRGQFVVRFAGVCSNDIWRADHEFEYEIGETDYAEPIANSQGVEAPHTDTPVRIHWLRGHELKPKVCELGTVYPRNDSRWLFGRIDALA